MDAMSVNGRDGAIRCSICINIYLASLRRALREMEARLPSSSTCLPVPRSRYAGFPREDVPLVLRTGLPFELQTTFPSRPSVPTPSLPSLARSPYPLPSYSQVVLPSSEPGYSRRHDRSAGIIRRVNGRRYCMQDQPASSPLHSSGCGAVLHSLAFSRSSEISWELRRARFGSINV